MSFYGSLKGVNSTRRGSSRSDVNGGQYQYQRSEAMHGGGNGYGPADPYMDSLVYSYSSIGGAAGGPQGGSLHQKAMILQDQCQDYLRKAENAMQTGGDAERYMSMARETIDQLKGCASHLRQMGQPNDNVVRSVEVCRDQLKGMHMAISDTLQRRRKSTRGNSGGWEEPSRSYAEAMGWIGQQKRLIETSPWGDDFETLQQQLLSHQKFHSAIQRSDEVDRARDDLNKSGDKGGLHALDQEWDSLQKLSYSRSESLQMLQHLIEEISREIMWVNSREEEELLFDWGDKDIDLYIPRKQESYSKLMSALEDKEMDLNKLKVKVDGALKNNHPAADKIEAYMDTLQTQWSWLLQITKCIHVHLKENAAYSQFFKEANETYSALQKAHETIRKKFTCDKDTSLETLQELLTGLEAEKEKIQENKRQVRHLVNIAKSIVRLKPRDPAERSSSTVVVRALCDFKQDQKVILKDNEGILKDNSQRSKWLVTGPGGLDMMVPSVCLVIPPPNPLTVSMAKKNEQYYDAILSIWNQLYINIRSLISWQYCLLDIENINSLTVAMLSRMSSEEYRSLIKRLETRFAEFQANSKGSQVLAAEDMATIESQFNNAQSHYEQLVVELPTYSQQASTEYVAAAPLQHIEQQQVQANWQVMQPVYLVQQQQPEPQVVIHENLYLSRESEEMRLDMERRKKEEDEERKRRKEEMRLETERKRREEEEMRLEEERRRAEEEMGLELERKRREEEGRLEMERRRREEEVRLEMERRRREEESRLAEEVRIREEKRLKDDQRRRSEVKKVAKKVEVIKSKAVGKVKASSASSVSASASSLSSSRVSSSRSLAELRSLRMRLRALEAGLHRHTHVCPGDDGAQECGVRITELETVLGDLNTIQGDILALKGTILTEVEGMADSDKAQYLRSEIEELHQRLGTLEGSLSTYLDSLRNLQDLLQSVTQGEDTVKVYEARLTEKDTTSLSPAEVEAYIMDLKSVKIELDQKTDVFDSMDAELERAKDLNDQMSDCPLRCELTLAKYGEEVHQLTDRWGRIKLQIDCRLKDLEFYQPRLQQYKSSSASLDEWISSTQKRQKALQSYKIEDLQTLISHINQQKALNSEIKEKRGTLDSVLNESGICVSSIKDYESDLAAYGSGLETLLNIPIKRTIIKSPATELNQEAVEMQTRYMELWTLSGDYYTYLGAMQKKMEELKIRNTRIDVLEEELRLLRGEIQGHTSKNRELQDSLSRYQLELSSSKDQLQSVEEVKRNSAMEVNSTMASLSSVQSQLASLREQLERLKRENEDELRKRRAAEDRYSTQHDEYENLMNKRKKEVQDANRAKTEAETNLSDKEHELEQLRRRLADELARVRELQSELTKVRTVCVAEMKSFKLNYESQIQASHADMESLTARLEEDAAERKLQGDRMQVERKALEEELTRQWVSIAEAEEVRRRAEQQALSQLSVITEEGRRRRDLEDQLELLIGQREADDDQHRAELVELSKILEEKSAQLAYVTHSLSEETRRRTILEEGQAVLEDTLAKMHVELASASVSVAGLKECREDLERMRFEIERQVSERSRVEQNVTRLQGRIKDLQSVRDALESQVEVLKKSSQEEVNQRKVAEAELAQTTCRIRENASTINMLHESQEKANTAEKRGEEEIRRLKSELEKSLRQNQNTLDNLKKLNVELKALQQNLLQEQAFVQEANLCKEDLYKSIENKSKALDQNSIELQRWKEQVETLTKERLRSEEVLLVVSQERDELIRSKRGRDEELVAQIAALELQLQSSNRSSLDYKNLVTELSSEREKLKLEIEKTRKQSVETTEDHDRIKLSSTVRTELKTASEPPTSEPLSLLFDGVRKPVTAKQLHDCRVLDEPTFNKLLKGKTSVPDVSVDKKVILKGTGPIAGVVIASPKGKFGTSGPLSKMSLSDAKKEKLLPLDCADLLLDAQAATGHMIDPRTNEKLTVDEALDQGLVDETDRQRLLAAEAAAVGYYDPGTGKPLSAFQAMKKGLIDKITALRLLQAQEATGGILDPELSVFLPKNTAMERDLINDEMYQALSQRPELYLDPETELGASYAALKRRCKKEPHTGLLLLPVLQKLDPAKLVFDGVRKTVTAKQLRECDVLDKPLFDQLLKGEIGVPDVSNDKKIILKGTGPIAGVVIAREKGSGSPSGPVSKMSLSEAKEKKLLPLDCADLLLDAQAATGHMIDPVTNQKLTVDEALDEGLVDETDRQRLLAAEAAAVGYYDPGTGKPLSAFQAMKKGLIDKNIALRLLQAQESTGGILDPVLSVFLPKNTAMERDLINDEMYQALSQRPELYLDPVTELGASYTALKRRCKKEPDTGLLLLPVLQKLDPAKLVFDGVRKPVTAKQLRDCDVLDKPLFDQLLKGEIGVPDVSNDKKIILKGTGPIAGVVIASEKGSGSPSGPVSKMSISEAKEKKLLPLDCADLLLDAQAATGHMIDPVTNQKLTVDEALDEGLVDETDRQRLLAAEAAAVGYYDPGTGKPLSAFQAMKKGLIDKHTALRLLQAQESTGGILDPVLSVFLPKDTAMERDLINDEMYRALNQRPELYLDPETELGASYAALKRRCKKEPHTGLLLLPVLRKLDPAKLVFDGVRKPVTAKQLHDCDVLDKPLFNQLLKGQIGVPDVSDDKKIILKGTGPIAGVVIASEKGAGSLSGTLSKMSLSEAKEKKLLPLDCADLLLDAQAATGHMIDPRTNQKLTVEEALDQGLVDETDRQRLFAAEAAAVGFHDPGTGKKLSAFQAMKKGLIHKNTALRLLEAQESAGGILDPVLSVFLPKDTAMERDLINEEMDKALNQQLGHYLDPETESAVSYVTLKRRCKTEPHTGLLLLPVAKKLDPSKLVFDGVRKPVTAEQLLDCGVIDKPTLKKLVTGEKTVPEVSTDKIVNLKGNGPIAALIVGNIGKMSFAEAKKQGLLPPESAYMLLEAQAATGHIIDSRTNQNLTVDEACDKGVVANEDRDRLLAAEAAAIGYCDRRTGKVLSVFEAMKRGIVDKKTALTLLQAQESAGGILDPVKSVFLPKDTAMKHNLLDEELNHALNQHPECYIDPESEINVPYETLRKKCKTESHTGLILLPISEKQDPNKLIFEGVRRPVTAQQLLDCNVLDKPTIKALVKGDATVPQVSLIKRDSLKGTGCISGVIVGHIGKMSFDEAKKEGLLPTESANLLLEAQAATGHIIDPRSNQSLTVEEACDQGVVAREDRDRLLAAEAAAIGYYDRSTSKPLSVFEALKKGLVDKKKALTLLQAQKSAGGILDPVSSVFLPTDTAIKHNLLDEDLNRALKQNPECYIDPETEKGVAYESLKKRCKTESHTGLILLPISGKQDPNKLEFDGVRKQVTAQQLLDCEVLDKHTFDQLLIKEKTIPEVAGDKKVSLKGSGAIAAVIAGDQGKMSFSEAKKQGLIPNESANKLLEAQAATGHIIDPRTNQKLTVQEACDKGVVLKEDRERLLAAEAAAIGYKDRSTGKLLSVFEAMKKGIVDKKTALTLLQAQESAGGILDPVSSVFLPKDTAVKRKLIDDELNRSLNQQPECYVDPDTEEAVTYESLKRRCKTEYDTGLLLLPISEKQDPNKLIFDGVRKSVTAQQLLDCEILDKPSFEQLLKKEKTIPEVSRDKKVCLKGTGAIAAVIAGDQGKMSFAEAKKQGLISTESANKLLEAQAATGHIIDPRTNQKLTVQEACDKGVVLREDRDRLLAAEAAAVGYKDRSTGKLLSVFEAMKKGIVDKKTALTLLQAQESAGGILDPVSSVFLPKDTAVKRKLIDDELNRSLNQQPECYVDPDTEEAVTYESLKRRCKTEYDTGLLLLPISEKQDPNKLIFEGVRKPVTAQQLLDCDVLDKPTYKALVKGDTTVPQVSLNKRDSLKGTGCISGVIVGHLGKMSFNEAKKQGLLPTESANLLLEAQAATGHIIDPRRNQSLTVEEACDKGVVAREDQDRLLAAEAAAIGYYDRSTSKPLSVFEALKKGLVDKKTALKLLQAQESSGGILDPVSSVFLPTDTAIKHNLLDEDLNRALKQNPECYIDPETEKGVAYESLKRRCKNEYDTGLLLLPISEKQDPNKIIFEGVRKSVTAQQLLDCEVLDKPSFEKLLKKEKNIPEISRDKKGSLKGTGAIAAVVAGDQGKMSFAEAKKQGLIPTESATKLLEAQAATGHIIDPRTNQKLTVQEACDKGVVSREDRERLLAAEAAAIGYKDRSTGKLLSVFEAMKKGIVDKETALTLLQAQVSAGGILDPVSSVFLPKDTAVKRKLIDDELNRSLNQQPECYVDPDTEEAVTYESLKRRCKTEYDTGLLLLPISEKQDPNKLIFDGVRKSVTAQQLHDCNVLDKSTFNKLLKKEKNIPEVSKDIKVSLNGTGAIAAVVAGDRGKMSFSEAKKQGLIPTDCANKLLAAQAATGYIIDPETNRKLTVTEACEKGVVAKEDMERLLAAESAAVGYTHQGKGKPLSVFEAMKKGILDKKSALTLLQAQESVGGILDPVNSVFLPKETAIKRGLMDEELNRSLNQKPQCYVDPETEEGVAYESLKRRCKTESSTGLLLLPISRTQNPNKLIFNGVRKQVTAQQLLDCGVLDKSTFNQLLTGKRTVSEVSANKKDTFKGAAPIAGVIAGLQGKMSFAEAKKQGLLPHDCANILLEAQAATGHIIDPKTNEKLSVKEACDKGVVSREDRERLLAAEFAAIGYTDGSTPKPLSVFEAMKKGIVDKKTAITLLQAQESAGGILDPVRSVYMSKDTAIQHNILDKELKHALNQKPECYIDPDTKKGVTYDSLKSRCKTESATGLLLLPIPERQTDNTTDRQLNTEERTVKVVSTTKTVTRKGTGVITTVIDGSKMSLSDQGKMSLSDQGKMSFSDQGKMSLSGQGKISLSGQGKMSLSDQGKMSHSGEGITSSKMMKHHDGCMDTETVTSVTTVSTKGWSKGESHTSQIKLNISEQQDPTKMIFHGIRRTVTAQQLLDCGILDKKTFTLLVEGKKTVSDVSVDKKLHLMGTGSIGGIAAGPLGQMSFAEARTKKMISPESANLLLDAQAATGYIIDPKTSQKLPVEDAYSKGVIDSNDRARLLAVEAAALGYKDPSTSKLLTAGQAMRKGLIDKDTALRILQAQESAGGILDPFLGVFLPRDMAMDRNLIDKQLYYDLNSSPECFLDPETQQGASYEALKKKCKLNPSTGLLLLPAPEPPITVQGLRGKVSIRDLADANLLEHADVQKLRSGQLTIQDIEQRLKSFLRGSSCIAGVYDESSKQVLPIYEAMTEELLTPGNALELLEAQAASGFMVDPVKNVHLTVAEALNRRLVGQEFKDRLLWAERAVTGYEVPDSDKVLSVLEAMERGVLDRSLGLRFLETQLASGGIIDPVRSHRVNVDVAYKRGYFNANMKQILANGEDTKGFTDPNTNDKLTYMELKQRCRADEKTGLILLPKQPSTQTNVRRKRRVIIVDPETNREMTVREAFDKGLIDYVTYKDLLMQECEWEEITVTAPDGSAQVLIVDRKTGKKYDITELIEKGVIDQSTYERYTSKSITLTEFADIITGKDKIGLPTLPSTLSLTSQSSSSSTSSSSSPSTLSNEGNSGLKSTSAKSSSSSFSTRPSSGKLTATRTTTVRESRSIISSEVSTSTDSGSQLSSVSITVTAPDEAIAVQEPVGAIFDSENLEKISIIEARNRGLVDSITAQRMLEAQACTGGIVDPSNGQRHGIQDAGSLGLIDEEMVVPLNLAQKAYLGFDNPKSRSKLSAAEAMREKWLPYEAGQRFMEYQHVTGGLFDPQLGVRRTIEDALNIGWLDGSTARKLQNPSRHSRTITCPKTKLKISYKDALDNCLLEEQTGVRMLQACLLSSRGISSPYTISAPGSRSSSRSSSQVGSRRSSIDLGSPVSQGLKQ